MQEQLDLVLPVTNSMMVPAAGPEHRVHPRYEVSLAITLLGENNFYVGLSQNISEGGVFISTHRMLPLGTPVVLSFILPRTHEPLVVTGVVQWIREPSALEAERAATKSGLSVVKPGMGIQFRDLDEATSTAIREFTRWRSPDFFD